MAGIKRYISFLKPDKRLDKKANTKRFGKTKKNTVGKIILGIFAVLISTISALFCQAIVWMFDTWKNLTISEFIYQLNAPVEGTNMDIIYDFIYKCIPGTVLVFFMAILFMIGLRKTRKSYWLSGAFIVGVSILCFAYFFFFMWTKLDISEYLKNQNTDSSFIDSNYVDVSDVQITIPENKRNLIYIYLESMEITYADIEDGGGFKKGCIPELVEIAQNNEDFSGATEQLNGAYAMPGATWTMGGIFAQTAGIPLVLPIHGNNMDTQETFFPSITTVGDILEEAGYTQTFFIGSDATFGGRALYLKEHGNYEIKDYYYAIEQGRIPENYYVWWGYEDKYLFEYAKEEILHLAEQEETFNFTMLTVDTHFEDGYTCSDCDTEHEDNTYANVMSCSSKKVKELVEWIQEQSFYENTTIVICGDHLTMDGDFCNELAEDYERKTYTVYINSAIEPEEPEWTRDYTTFDQYPTTLASLGIEIQGNRLGLGTNLFSSRQTLTEKYGRAYVKAEVQKESKLLTELADTVDTDNEAIINREGRYATAEVTAFEYDYYTECIPVMISAFENITDIVSVNIKVWTEEDQSDERKIAAELQEDGTYIANLDLGQFEYKTGEYFIEAYLMKQDGGEISVGSTTVMYE